MKHLTLAIVLLLGLFGCSVATVTQTPVAEAQELEVPWQGEWVVSNWQERGTLTLQYDGEVAKIVEQNGIYTIEGISDAIIIETKFRLGRRNILFGNYIATYDNLVAGFSSLPDGVLRQAAASKSVIYSVSLTAIGRGKIAVERNNCQIFWNQKGFAYSQQVSGWIKFILTKK